MRRDVKSLFMLFDHSFVFSTLICAASFVSYSASGVTGEERLLMVEILFYNHSFLLAPFSLWPCFSVYHSWSTILLNPPWIPTLTYTLNHPCLCTVGTLNHTLYCFTFSEHYLLTYCFIVHSLPFLAGHFGDLSDRDAGVLLLDLFTVFVQPNEVSWLWPLGFVCILLLLWFTFTWFLGHCLGLGLGEK